MYLLLTFTFSFGRETSMAYLARFLLFHYTYSSPDQQIKHQSINQLYFSNVFLTLREQWIISQKPKISRGSSGTLQQQRRREARCSSGKVF
ncbi:hypothetical protein GJ744_004331 [Endocarpon pusillum]|uniref:Uncharacterized protein n=1 Tax=Endocarpon pusillum TaxID=364733 RepID=A0A8H7A808_9EURO|nr:hypothetical protein GJ744_004331 [Endocarpon pusillum]